MLHSDAAQENPKKDEKDGVVKISMKMLTGLEKLQ